MEKEIKRQGMQDEAKESWLAGNASAAERAEIEKRDETSTGAELVEEVKARKVGILRDHLVRLYLKELDSMAERQELTGNEILELQARMLGKLTQEIIGRLYVAAPGKARPLVGSLQVLTELTVETWEAQADGSREK